ncbi:membrane-targeted effector domain-containing toxin [Pseudomonas sp. URMO17WK12:I11]|uniref:membrane-targeted effector domain-containing toxin n=1 Tax=Pseudomonas sp. URMO17WK12:I11 TaxID=1283291 RepID=UPI0011A46CAE|nr:membrane-targeted effector domain-containing toxin [Pseudomonas sp. URMO17WK12:I11]
MSQTSMVSPSDRHTLQQLANDLVTACPDMRQQAREVALDILRQHRLGHLEPDSVYLHRFANAHSASTFSGWAHSQQPIQSFTLPQLVLHRFNAEDADNADLLSYLSGFYLDGPGAASYDAHNEVALKPADVLAYFWQIDFCTDYNQRVDSFWASHADDFRTLSKVNFLSKVLEVRHQAPGSALAKCCGEVAEALLAGAPWPPSLAQLQASVTAPPGMRLCTFDIGGYVATDILRIVLQDGRQLLYTPGAEDALHLFADSTELYWWVLINNNYDENRARFSSHFALKDRGQRGDLVGLDHLTDLLYEGWGKHTYAGLNLRDQTLNEDPFTWLRDQARQRMRDDAEHALQSNADLRKQLWIGYLGAFDQVFGPLAALDWPVALVAVGAGLAEVGLDIDQAVHARTTAQRKAAITGAILAAVGTLFNATFLLGAPGELAEPSQTPRPAPPDGEIPFTDTQEPAPLEPDATAHSETQAWVPKPFWPTQTSRLLAPFETNVLLSTQAGSGRLAGIYAQQGKFYALVDSLPYQVRYVAELQHWVIVDPANPYSFYNCHIIRLDGEGNWQLVPRPKLDGGGMSWLKVWGRSSTSSRMAPLPLSPYEIPEALRPDLSSLANSPSSSNVLSGTHVDIGHPEREAALAEFRARRTQLATDAAQFLADPTLPERPAVPELAPSSSAKVMLEGVYQNADGLVVAEAHSGIGSKRLLIENMGTLRKQKVRTLYLEHYMTDFQQADLDTFNRTGRMPQALDRYVNAQDIGHATDPSGRYTFRRLLKQAQKNGIFIQSIDCMASYRQAWAEATPANLRQQMMNFYAHKVIEADQALRGPSKWVALVGNSHSDFYQGVPGIGDLQGAITLRCEDVAIGQPDMLDIDPGLQITLPNQGQLSVKSNLRLRAAVRTPEQAAASIELRLISAGDYLIDAVDGQQVLVHRGRDGALRRTPIKHDGRFLYLERSDWPWINGRRMPDVSDLHTRLQAKGMRRIAR